MCDLVLNDLHRVQGDNQRDSASLKNHVNVLDFCFFPEFHVSALKAAKQCFQRTLCVFVRIACICGCVCNIPESVRGMRITSDRGRMWRLLLPCEGRCCLPADSCRRSRSAVCVCVCLLLRHFRKMWELHHISDIIVFRVSCTIILGYVIPGTPFIWVRNILNRLLGKSA